MQKAKAAAAGLGALGAWLAVLLLVIRGLPVIFDAIPYIQQSDREAAAAASKRGQKP